MNSAAMNPVAAAASYTTCRDLWVVTSYYNPAGYRIKREIYEQFARPILQANIPLLTVECAFDAHPFELAPSPQVIQVRGRDVMWLKERLINLAISHLPPHARKVLWIDCDLLFCNADWAVQTARLLDEYPLVQPCAMLHRLGRDQSTYRGYGPVRRSFADQLQQRPESACLWNNAHGFPGGAWAARRQMIERYGLYDAAICGGGDELFAHAAGGGLNSRCVKGITSARRRQWPVLMDKVVNRLLRVPWPRWLADWYLARAQRPPTAAPDEPFFANYLGWAQPFYAAVQGRIGRVHGMALHLWHGNPVNRQYGSRKEILRRHHFDPTSDLRLNDDGLWEWASEKPGLHQALCDYFDARLEDE